MDLITMVGLWAAGCTTFAFLPQLIQVWKYKRTRDISLTMYIIFTTGVSLWLTYGILKNDLPLIIANVITLIFAVSILAGKYIYK